MGRIVLHHSQCYADHDRLRARVMRLAWAEGEGRAAFPGLRARMCRRSRQARVPQAPHPAMPCMRQPRAAPSAGPTTYGERA